MNDREKLIELLDEKCYDEWYGNDEIADHLLANGVIVLPCKVGDTVWEIYEGEILSHEVGEIHLHSNGISIRLITGIYLSADEVSLTREEAEAALKEGKG